MTVKTFDALRFTDDTPDVAYSPYLAALGRPETLLAVLDSKPLYATTDEILTAMLQVRGTSDTNLPLALGEDPDSPELFLASITPYGLDLLGGECALWLHLTTPQATSATSRYAARCDLTRSSTVSYPTCRTVGTTASAATSRATATRQPLPVVPP